MCSHDSSSNKIMMMDALHARFLNSTLLLLTVLLTNSSADKKISKHNFATDNSVSDMDGESGNLGLILCSQLS